MSSSSSGREKGAPWSWIVLLFIFQLWPLAIILLIYKLIANSGFYSSNTFSGPRTHTSTKSRQKGQPNVYRPGEPLHKEEEFDWRKAAKDVEAIPLDDRPPSAGKSEKKSQNTYTGSRPSSEKTPPKAQTPPRPARPAYTAQDGSPPRERTAPSGKRVNLKRGRFLQVFGGLLIVSGAIASIITFLSIIQTSFMTAVWVSSIVAASTVLVGLVMWFPGSRMRARAARCQTIHAILKNREDTDIFDIAAAVPCSASTATKDLRWMIHQGFFPGAFIDASKHMVVFSGIHRAEKEKPQPPQPEGESLATQTAKQIRRLNDVIEDDYVSERMDRLEELAVKIFNYVEQNPAKERRIRSFQQHYLPKTIGILESYARFENQGVSGANIRTAMKEVEEIMDTLVAGFEKQLDMLFADEAMDVSTDISVLENMMSLDDDDPFQLETLGGNI